MACHLTTADFINQQADGPFLDATWKCRVPGCVKVPGEHPAPIVQPGNYLILCNSLSYFHRIFPYLYNYIYNIFYLLRAFRDLLDFILGDLIRLETKLEHLSEKIDNLNGIYYGIVN